MSILDDITDKAALARELYPHGILVGDDVLEVAGIDPQPGKSARVFLQSGIVYDFNGPESYDLVTVAKHRWGLDDKDTAALLRVKGYLPQPPSSAEVARRKAERPSSQAPKLPRDANAMHPVQHCTHIPEDMTLHALYSLEAYVPALGKEKMVPPPWKHSLSPSTGGDGQDSPLRWPHRSREGPSGGVCTPLDDPGRLPEGHRGPRPSGHRPHVLPVRRRRLPCRS